LPQWHRRTRLCAPGTTSISAPRDSIVVAPVAVLAVVVNFVAALLVLVVILVAVFAPFAFLSSATMFLEGLASGLALFIAQFAVAIFIESCEEGRSRGFTIARGTTRPMRWTTAMARRSATIGTTSARAVVTRPAPKVSMKCLVGGFVFFVTQLSIAVLVDSPEHRLAEFFTTRTVARSRMMRTTRTGPRTTMSIAFATAVVLATGHGFVATVSAMVWAAMRRSTAVVLAMGELAVTALARPTGAGSMARMMPVTIAVVTLASVGRLVELLPHIGPFCIAQLAIAIGVEASEHDVTERIATVTAMPCMIAATMLMACGMLLVFVLLALLLVVLLLVVLLLVGFLIPVTSSRLVVRLGLIPLVVGASRQC